ncbi:MAG: carboxyltransferase domain-containing protein, partial [Caldisericia bacterium]|nr:carboxyltransferase domain-containing protein [Caldisericia bacterium]
IGGEQLGIYSLPSPGGFRIIGFTYLDLFEVNENLKIKISEGDFVKFRNVSKDEFLKNYDGEIKFL